MSKQFKIFAFNFIVMMVSLSSCTSLHRAGVPEGMRRLEANELLKKYEVKVKAPLSLKKDFRLYYIIDKWYGVPYGYGQASIKGIDCSGFTGMLSLEVYNKKIPRSSIDQYQRSQRFKRQRRLKQGNLVFFTFVKGKEVSHVGMYLKNGYFVHASSSKGVIISELNQKYYQNGYVASGKLR